MGSGCPGSGVPAQRTFILRPALSAQECEGEGPMEHHRSLLKTDLGVIYEGTLFHPLQQFSFFFFFFFPISKHHCPYQSQVPCPKQSMKAGRMLFLFSRYLWSIWGRISQITGQCQPRLIRTLTGPALGLWTTQEGPYPQVGTCRCCLDRRLFNMLSRTRISPVALKRNRHTEPQV